MVCMEESANVLTIRFFIGVELDDIIGIVGVPIIINSCKLLVQIPRDCCNSQNLISINNTLPVVLIETDT